ncbi:MAG: guanylate kinase [Patescibacteria group bacterium]
MNAPVPILIVGPSGVGKSTIIDRIAAIFPQLERLKTTTTRAPRHTCDDRYHFVNRDQFEQMIKHDDFLEWTETHGNLYGTERAVLNDILGRDKYPLPNNAIDIKGVEAYKRAFPDLVAIFIAYDSLEQLPDRIRRTRPGTSEEEIARRMATAKAEMAAINQFDHVVFNHEGSVDQAVSDVAAILTATLAR